MLEIKTFVKTIDFHTMTKINELVYVSDIKEPFSLGDIMFVGYKDNKLVAVEVFKLEELNGEILPRFIHILFHPSVRRSKLTVSFLIRNENKIAKFGYKKTWAYILKERCNMAILAMKFGFKKLAEDVNSFTLVKKIGD